ncbi:uncharacterized protein ACHE_11658A [Aspergillus chevalieri]|uniref:Uncharacterized protein n=1 Tax=Aspergillus chevalieri TaxID=182096 RepID=A0A7R7VGD0_ASPCH|nr:uncharacterized protein ACHE_11658A [Aspergillus chevalieri]BCR84256.1 hypothetical protein ACHE_11658A [Aspergillus chevalieri]
MTSASGSSSSFKRTRGFKRPSAIDHTLMALPSVYIDPRSMFLDNRLAMQLVPQGRGCNWTATINMTPNPTKSTSHLLSQDMASRAFWQKLQAGIRASYNSYLSMYRGIKAYPYLPFLTTDTHRADS